MRLHEELLKKPEPVPADSLDDKWKWFKNCVGVLGGTHIKIRVPLQDRPRYVNRKGDITTNVLGACFPDGQFIYVLSGWEGFANDGQVLSDAVTRRHALRVPEGCYYLVDTRYTNCEGFLAPFKGKRYNLSEWSDGCQPANSREFFNMKHSAAHNVINRCFGLLKKRWAVLRNPLFYLVRTHNLVIIACCLLHNLIMRENAVDPFADDLGDLAINNVPSDTNPISVIEPTWSNWRDTLADDMCQTGGK